MCCVANTAHKLNTAPSVANVTSVLRMILSLGTLACQAISFLNNNQCDIFAIIDREGERDSAIV